MNRQRILLLFLWVLASCRPVAAPAPTPTPTVPPTQTATPPPTLTATAPPTVTPAPTTTPTPPLCPQATPEYFAVQPVVSPTELLTQTIQVELGNSEMITITTESGVFTAPAGPLTIDLLPNTTHHLLVTGRVREVSGFIPGCTYGGYTMSLDRDVNGDPLVIEQRTP